MRPNKSPSNWVSASDVGRAEFCAHYLQHKYADTPVDEAAKARREYGNAGHDQLNIQASKDKRCFIASYLYGSSDPRTENLRVWRDTTLTNKIYGPSLVKLYYLASPTLVWICQKNKWINAITQRSIDRFSGSLKGSEKL